MTDGPDPVPRPDRGDSAPASASRPARGAWLLVRSIESVSRFSGAMAAVLLAAIVALMLAEIVFRSSVARSLHFTWEYSSYAMAGVFLLGASYALHCGSHVRVTALLESVPPTVGRWLDWLCTLLGLAVAAFATQALAVHAFDSYTRGIVSFTINQVPLVYPQGLMALGAGLLALQFVARLIRLSLGAMPDVIPADEALPPEDARG